MKFFFLLLLFPLVVFADPDDDCKGDPHHCNGGGDDISTVTSVDIDSPVSNSVRHSSKSFGFGGSDVDINDCYRSWSFIVQGSQPNYWCMANDLDARGLHEAAAKSRCKIRGYRELFGDQAECERVSTISMVVAAVDEEHLDEEEEWHEEQLQLQIDYDTRLAQLEDQLNRPPPKPQIIERTVVEQKPLLSDEKRAKLQAVLDE